MNQPSITKKEQTPSPLSVYRRAIQIMEQDSVHDAIVKGGIEILQKGIPYVVVASRWQKLKKFRKKSAQDLPITNEESIIAPPSIWDPFEQVSQNEVLKIITDSLADFSDEDIIAVWGHAEGRSDKEILQIWIDQKLGPPNPKLSLIRKRRERALKRLRSILKNKFDIPKND